MGCLRDRVLGVSELAVGSLPLETAVQHVLSIIDYLVQRRHPTLNLLTSHHATIGE